MHKKDAGKGLAAVSVSLDDPRDMKVRPKIEQFLRQQEAAFANFVLDATEDEWQDRLKIKGLPCVYVFDRDNHVALKLVEDAVDYAVIEKKVQELLQH
jgi:hypothetical protein